MSCYAALDIGSNSVRLLVGEVQDGRIQPLLRQLRSTRLLAGASGGWLQQEAVERTVSAAAELVAMAQPYSPVSIACIATSAAREARNPELLGHRLLARTGMQLAIIDGRTEACLAYLGALAGLMQPVADPLVIDIGGGSTELSWRSNERLYFRSIPVGAVRVTERTLTGANIKEALLPALTAVQRHLPGLVIGTGGTVTTVAAMELGLEVYNPDLVHGICLTAARVKAWGRQLAALTLAEREKIPGLQPQRADIIVAGITILTIILEELAAARLIVSEADLLWGLLLAQAEGRQFNVQADDIFER